MSKLDFFVRRTLQLVVTVWAIASALFVMFRLMPGDPTAYIISPGMGSEVREQIIESYGLNDPLWVQYLRYLENLATLNLGRSFHSGRPVSDILANYLPNTLILMLTAFILAYVVGVTLGVLTGWYRGSHYEKSAVVTALVGRSVPSFWTGLLALWIFGATFNLVPLSGMSSIGTENTSFWNLVFSVDFLHHLITPVVVLAFYYMGYPLLIMRNSMLDTLSEDFIDICRAKGISERAVMFRHAARNAMLPVVTAAAIAVGFAVGGSVLVETVFGWPGIGRTMINAVLRRDYPVAQGTFLVLSLAVVIMNFVADLLYGVLDPRVTYE